jgi:RNA polymerase sigma-70 factor (ECF subfamily)
MSPSDSLPHLAGRPVAATPGAAAPADTQADEARLLQRLAARDPSAMVEAYAVFAAPVFGYAIRAMGSREEAEEVLQDTFVRLWDKAADYNPALGRPFTWVFLLARGICLDRQRRLGRRSRRMLAAASNGNTPGDCQPRVIPRDELRRVLAALAALPPADRRAVEMAVFLEYTGQEIADDTREPLGTVKSRIRRGLARLRHLLHHD